MAKARSGKGTRRRDKGKRYSGGLRDAMTALLPARVLPLLPVDGKTRWTARLLVLCAILMSWGGGAGSTLADRFASARRCLVRWYPGRRRPGEAYGGFVAALRRRGGWLVRQVARHYRTHVRRLAGARGQWTVEGWVAFAADSTKHDAPMTAANEGRLGCASKGGSWPQMVLTTLLHLGSGLPWSFTAGRARSSERRHLLGLLCTPPKWALLLADAGFTGYAFWRKVIASRRAFLVRVGGNVRVLRELLGVTARVRPGGVVWVWPADERKRRRPPLALRLITLVDGRNRAMYLLSSVLDHERLSDASAARLYAMRWGVEVMYRGLKQTLARRKLLSDAPRNARMELSWAMIGLWTLMLIKAERCTPLGANAGVAAVLRVLRRAISGEPMSVTRTLARLTPDAYPRTRPKAARHWPHRKRARPPGAPKARNATDAERALAKELEALTPAA